MFEKRLKDLQKSLTPKKIDALIVSGAVNIAYLTGYSNFSRNEREAYLFITGANAVLFTDGRYIEAVRNIPPKEIRFFLHAELYRKIRNSKAKRIGVEQNFTLSELKKFKKETKKKFVLTEQIVENLRAVKDSSEIKNIKLACNLTDRCHSDVLKNIRMNITERKLAWRIEKFIKENGGELAFDTIVAFGPNSAIPHHKTSNKKLTKEHQFVLLDFGAKVNGYCSDMTRTLLTKGASNRAHKMLRTVLNAQKAVEDFISRKWYDRSLDHIKTISGQKAAELVNESLRKEGFGKIPHGLGHGIGLEVHEEPRLSPKSKAKLVRNNVFTIEPGIYIPGFGGVRIEDDFLLSNKLERITKAPQGLPLLNL